MPVAALKLNSMTGAVEINRQEMRNMSFATFYIVDKLFFHSMLRGSRHDSDVHSVGLLADRRRGKQES